jgi:hypothetical protein
MRVGDYLAIPADMGRPADSYGSRTIDPASGQYFGFRSNPKFGRPCNSVLPTNANVALDLAAVAENDAHASRMVEPWM